MEVFHEKVYAVAADKQQIVDIFSVGRTVHDSLGCNVNNCDAIIFLKQLADLLNDEPDLREAARIKFIEIAANNISLFITFDQLNKKIGRHLFTLDKESILLSVYYEIEKIKSYLKYVNKKKIMENHSLVLEKTFV